MTMEATPKCRRHDWYSHSEATTCRTPDGTILAAGVVHCRSCFKPRDEAVVKRNRRNRQRGGAFERQVAKEFGGRRTGPLLGRDDVVTDSMFAIQTKRSLRLSLNEARTYLTDLRRTFPARTPLVVHALPGERDGVVILTKRDWLELHGPPDDVEYQPREGS
jgi:hypothetical protein